MIRKCQRSGGTRSRHTTWQACPTIIEKSVIRGQWAVVGERNNKASRRCSSGRIPLLGFWLTIKDPRPAFLGRVDSKGLRDSVSHLFATDPSSARMGGI